jgi:hypothetical protein
MVLSQPDQISVDGESLLCAALWMKLERDDVTNPQRGTVLDACISGRA